MIIWLSDIWLSEYLTICLSNHLYLVISLSHYPVFCLSVYLIADYLVI